MGSDMTEAGALTTECKNESESALYTSTSFYIWLRFLREIRAIVWVLAAACSTAAASSVVSGIDGYKALIAGITLAGVILPGILKAVALDEAIEAYQTQASKFKIAEARLRRCADVWSQKPIAEFEAEARAAFAELDEARKFSLTPPEWTFRNAQKKIKAGHYKPD